jgi:hypothetical protein
MSCTHVQVTLVIPWLCQVEQAAIFPEGRIFSAPCEQVAPVFRPGP